MKEIRNIILCAVAAAALASCTYVDVYTNVPEDPEVTTPACSFSSDDPLFSSDGDGYSVSFKSLGGEVVIKVDCQDEWFVLIDGEPQQDTASRSGASWLNAVADCRLGTLTLSCGQNTVTQTNSATVTIAVGSVEQPVALAGFTVTQNAYGTPEISAASTTVTLPAVGQLTQEVAVESSFDSWSVETACQWLLVEQTDGAVIFTADANTDTESRSTDVTLVSDNGSSKATETVRVTQDGAAYITLSQGFLSFYEDGTADVDAVSVETNFDWDFSYDAANGWFTVTREENELTVTVDENSSDNNRTGYVVITSGDGAENVAEQTLTVTQMGLQSSSMILVYTITEAGTTAKLPLYDEVNCTVDWGDGTVEEITDAQPTHTYEQTGTYNVSVNGSVSALNSKSFSTAETKLITGIRQWGALGLTSLEYAFYGCSNIDSAPADETGAFADVTTCQQMFYNCGVDNKDGTYSGLSEISADLFQYAVKCTSFHGVFWNCYNLQEIPTGLFRNCEAVTAFGYAFENCYCITGVPDDLFYNCPNVTDMVYMFSGCSALTNIPEGFFDKNVNVTSFTRTFYDCSSLTHIPENLFAYNTKNTSFNATFHGTSIETIPEGIFDNNPLCESFTCTFQECAQLKEIPAELLKYASKCTTIASIFYGCSSLETIPTGLFDYLTDACTSVSYAFRESGVKSIPEGLFAKCTGATSGNGIFQDCAQLESLPSDLFVGLENITGLTGEFYGCSSLKEIPEGLFNGLTKVTTATNLFRGCSSLTSIPKGLFEPLTACKTLTYIFQDCTSLTEIEDEAFAGNTVVTTYLSAFSGCTGLKTVGAKAFYGNTAVTTISNIFKDCSSLESVGESAFEGCSALVTASSVFADLANFKSIGKRAFAECKGTNMTTTKMFQNCVSLTDVGEELFADCTTLKTVSYLFNGCTGLESVPEDIFDGCSVITTVTQIFAGCTNLKELSGKLLSTWSSVTTASYLFQNCTSLTTLPEDLLDGLTKATNLSYAFAGCSGLTSLPAGLFDKVLTVTNFSNAFNGCSSLKGESPYTTIEVDDEPVNVHLYERTAYTTELGCSAPKTITNCFTGCTGLSDYATILANGWATE